MDRRFRNISGEDCWVAVRGQLRKVPAEGVIDVDDDNFWQPSLWRDETTKTSSPKQVTTPSEGSK